MSSKKHTSKKELKKLATQLIESGKTKQETFEELSSQYYESDTIARVIGSIPSVETKQNLIQ